MANQKILVVEDSMVDFLYVKNILASNGYEVSHADSGEKALTLAKEQKPDCILMDVVMPEMNGFQATRALSRDVDTSDIPVIVLSSKSQKTDLVWAQRQGAKGYVVKPADPKQLIRKLKAAMA